MCEIRARDHVIEAERAERLDLLGRRPERADGNARRLGGLGGLLDGREELRVGPLGEAVERGREVRRPDEEGVDAVDRRDVGGVVDGLARFYLDDKREVAVALPDVVLEGAAVVGGAGGGDATNAGRRIPGRIDGGAGLLSGVDHRHEQAVGADIEQALDAHRVVRRHPDDGGAVGGRDAPDAVGDRFEAKRRVFGVHDDEIEAAARGDFRDGGVRKRGPRSDGSEEVVHIEAGVAQRQNRVESAGPPSAVLLPRKRVDSCMSDFDREAEREKLREKYEEDKEKRQASERMSELLLQGATMTNRHCKECHSPVFRYEGDEFCPTCQQVVDENGNFVGPAAEEDGAASAEAAANGQQPAPEPEPAETTAAEGQPSPGESTAGTEPQSRADPSEPTVEAAAEPADEQIQDEVPTETRPAPARERRPARVDPPARREADADGEAAGESAAGDLGAAEAALAREIAALSRQAEETRDVGRKRDLFAAAREAAETLQTVRRL